MNKEPREWYLSGRPSSWSPDSLNPTIYWDNGASYMASDGSSWSDRIGGLTMSATGTGHSRATGINNKLKLVNTTSGYWNRARITSIQGVVALTIWGVGKVIEFEQYFSGNQRTGMVNDGSNGYGMFSNGSSAFGSIARTSIDTYWIIVFDGSLSGNSNKLKIWMQGTQQTLSFTGTIPNTTSNNASEVPQIGRGGTTVRASDNYEIGVITRAITSNEITSLNSFLATRYGL